MNSNRYKIYLAAEKDQKKIINLYIDLEEKCVHQLNTEFSFVIHDQKKQRHFAACDIIGTRPLYYTVLDNIFYFAEDIGILFQESKIGKELNIQTMKTIVNHSAIAYDETMYKDIKRLPPGHYMYVSKEGVCIVERYWKPEKIQVNYGISEKEVQEQFCSLFDKAIFDRIDDMISTGFELSGGLDSSAIVSWVKYQKPYEKVTAFSMNFPSIEKCDESEYVESMQEKYSLCLQNLATDKMDYKFRYSLENTYKLNPYWPIFITYTMGFSILEEAKELGVKTILTGQGGDNILTGNLYVLHEYFRKFKWIQLYKELKAVPNKKYSIKQYLLFPLLGEKNVKTLRYIYQKFKLKDKPIQYNKDIYFKEYSDYYEGSSITFKSDLIQVLHSSLSVLMQSSYYQLAKKHFGIEFKHPFFDRRLIEFMLSLPPEYKYTEGIQKILLRDSLKEILPEKIRQRTDKAEFSEVLRQQIDSIDLDHLFNNANLAKLGLIDQKKLDKHIENYLNGNMKKILYFWQLINLEFWYRYNFVDDHGLDK